MSPANRRLGLKRHPLGSLKGRLSAVFIGFLVCQPVPLFAAGSLSPAQLDGLAAEALNHTPEHTHFAKGTKFSWVLFPIPESDRQSALLTRIREKLASRYRVYDAEEDLPAGSVATGERGKRYLDGFLFTVTATRVSADTMEITYVDYEAPMAACRQTIRYRWTGSRWRVVRTSPLAVS